jgi:Recombination endonuclease VII
MALKLCSDCGEHLPVEQFYWVSKSSGRLRGQCKDCMRISKMQQRSPNWTPACFRCGARLPTRVGSGRRLCAECFAETYDLEFRRTNGAHRITLKPCTLCGGAKERFERGKLCGACRSWALYARSLRRFGLTPRDYASLLSAQGGVCYICGSPPSGQRLSIDHDHSIPEGRDAVRGLLCRDCNYSRLPVFAESTTMLQRAISYLSDPPARRVLGRGVASTKEAPCREADSVDVDD